MSFRPRCVMGSKVSLRWRCVVVMFSPKDRVRFLSTGSTAGSSGVNRSTAGSASSQHPNTPALVTRCRADIRHHQVEDPARLTCRGLGTAIVVSSAQSCKSSNSKTVDDRDRSIFCILRSVVIALRPSDPRRATSPVCHVPGAPRQLGPRRLTLRATSGSTRHVLGTAESFRVEDVSRDSAGLDGVAPQRGAVEA